MVANFFLADTPDPGDGIIRSEFIFLDYGHVAYQIKENHECSNMVANILAGDPPPDPWDRFNRSKFNIFRT